MRFSEHYQPFPHQQKFHDSLAKYRLFGGAAGPGKTKALLWEAAMQANAFAGVETLLLRRTFPELEMSLLAEFRKNLPSGLYAKYNDSKRVITWKNGSTTRFGYCRNENDVYQYQGAEFLFIGIDELTHFTLKQWQFLTSRNRCPVPGSFPCMAGATNPGNIGHAWVKALFIDKHAPPGMDRPELYDAREYDFIPARISDNPIYANDANYIKTLELLPGALRKAMLDGDWNVFAGQYFDIFTVGRHTRRPEAMPTRQPWWRSWISIDWGFEHPSAVYWHTQMPAAPGEAFGLVLTYRELVKNRLSPRMLGQAIAERCTEDEKISDVLLSPDAFAHRTAEASIAEQLGDVLASCGLPRPVPADDDRIGGWQLLYQLLEGEHWIVSESCAGLIGCLPALVRDEKHVEDVKKVDGDDPADAARYGLVHLKSELASKPRDVAVAEQLAAGPLVERIRVGELPSGEPIIDTHVKDMTSYAIQAQKLEAEARKKFQPVRFGRRRR